jgi:ectoine hydroxylase-related dioxygenase (phytanoyl-CoA dioxygenase family)
MNFVSKERLTIAVIATVTSIYSRTSSPASSSSEISSINKNGYYIRKNLLDKKQIDNILVNFSSQSKDGTTNCREVSSGRIHHNLLGSLEFRELKEIKDLIADEVLPLVKAEMNMEANQLIITEVQIVDSLPGSSIQIWHADNAYKGVTVMIPLVDLTETNGATYYIKGSQTLWENMTEKNLKIERPLLIAGDAVVADARILHRGGANKSDSSRPMLVIRFDDIKTPPPGMTFIGATVRFYVAKILTYILEPSS